VRCAQHALLQRVVLCLHRVCAAHCTRQPLKSNVRLATLSLFGALNRPRPDFAAQRSCVSTALFRIVRLTAFFEHLCDRNGRQVRFGRTSEVSSGIGDRCADGERISGPLNCCATPSLYSCCGTHRIAFAKSRAVQRCFSTCAAVQCNTAVPPPF
jgi:hypothetical protein